MAKAYFIGGAPRAGKTTALNEFIKRTSMLGASTDAIRQVIRSVIEASDNDPLFELVPGKIDSPKIIELMRNNPSKVVDDQNRESEIVWKSVIDFVNSNIGNGQDVAIEGVAVLPQNFATELPFDYEVVFIANLQDQTDAIIKHAHENHFDWLHKYPDEFVRAFCHYNQELNKYYYQEAIKYQLPVVLVEDDFHASIRETVDILSANHSK